MLDFSETIMLSMQTFVKCSFMFSFVVTSSCHIGKLLIDAFLETENIKDVEVY